MKFAMSYSCGKDSTFALHKMAEQGHEPVCLIVMIREGEDRSYFHGADRQMLECYEKALDLPMILCPTAGEDYDLAFEEGLRRARDLGAEAACFGDIDLEENRKWEEDRCERTGLLACFPLWQTGREENVRELVAKGYRCLMKSINQKLLPRELLGKYIDEEAIGIMRRAGIDICGENGEYHTLVTDGPLFREPLTFHTGEILEFGDYAVIDISV